MGKEDFYGEIYGKREENPTNKGGKIPTYAKSTVSGPTNQTGDKKEPQGNAWDSTSKGKESADFKPKTEEDLAKERKRRKFELIAGAIGDGISSLSNLFFASKGAPSTINTSGKKTVPSLMDSIRSKHKEQDSKYNDALTAWQKEQEKKEREFEKKKKEAEKIAKENERQNDIHADFRPLKSNWQSVDFLSYIYDDFRAELNHRKYHNTLHQIENQINNASARSRPYLMQDLIQYALDDSHDFYSDESKKELNEEFISMLRKRWSELDSEWEKMK